MSEHAVEQPGTDHGMRLAPETGQWLDFVCNVCGMLHCVQTAKFHRELAHCPACGSNARFRGMVAALGDILQVPAGLALVDWPRQPQVRGLGMSDWPGYADVLARKMAYVNTHFDRSPRLDILDPGPQWLGVHDFVLSTDVLEHVLPPVQRAFDHLLALLRPGGWLVFSVPYTTEAATREHYPGVVDFDVARACGQEVVVWRSADGRLHLDAEPVFHGGSGATLELRVFGREAVLAHLAQAGFERVRVLDTPRLGCGYYWPPIHEPTPQSPPYLAYIILAQRPLKS